MEAKAKTEVEKFFNFLYRNCPDGSGHIDLRHKDPNGKVAEDFLSVDHIGEIPSILSKHKNSDWWYGIALRNGCKGKKDNISLVPGFHLEHDNLTLEKEREIQAFLKPTIIVQTSLPTKKQLIWLLKEPAGPEEIPKVEDINRRLINRFGGDKGTHDASRMLRIPTTLNHKPKYGRPLECKILELNEGCEYSLDDFEILPQSDNPQTEGSFKKSERLERIMRCEFLKHCDKDRATSPEPEWYAMISILAREPGGLDLIHSLSRGYPTYSPQETDRKIRHALNDSGPATCTHIKNLWDCGRDCGVKNPAALAYKIEVTGTKETYEIGINLTDLGNARRFVAAHGRDLRYCFPWGKWLFYDGQRWTMDDVGEVNRRAKDTVGLIYKEAAGEKDNDRRKALASHALRCESDGKLKAMIELAKSEPGIPILPDEMDRDPWLLNVSNGTVNLLTGELYSHERENLITKLAPVEYRSEVDCRYWKEHLKRIMDDNQDLISFLQRGYGYSLTGIADERIILIQHGSGANGKTTTNEVIAVCMGDYAVRTPTETLLVKREGSIPNDLAKLKGARFVFCSEADEGKRLAESLIKDLTGGDTIAARFMRGEWFEFEPSFKVWLATNHKPIIRGTDNAIWDRIKLIPFTVSIPECDRIPHREMLPNFEEELSGILAWMVQGCLDWQRIGLGTPQEVREATGQYREEMDLIGEFINDCCIISNTKEISAKHLYEKYCKWSEANGEKPIAKRTFGTRLIERGFLRGRASGGARQWKGIGVESDVSDT